MKSRIKCPYLAATGTGIVHICIYNRNAQAQARADRSLQRQGKTLAQVALLRVGISR